MAMNLPNMDWIAKDNIKVEEALKKVQDFSNQNIATATGNAVPAPPASAAPASPPPPSQTTTPAPFPSPRVPAPPISFKANIGN